MNGIIDGTHQVKLEIGVANYSRLKAKNWCILQQIDETYLVHHKPTS